MLKLVGFYGIIAMKSVGVNMAGDSHLQEFSRLLDEVCFGGGTFVVKMCADGEDCCWMGMRDIINPIM